MFNLEGGIQTLMRARVTQERETLWLIEVLVETKIDLNDCQTMISDNFLYFVVKEYKENYYV